MLRNRRGRALILAGFISAPLVAAACGGKKVARAACADPGCGNEQRALLDFIQANKACASAADCLSERVSCGITEDDCTGAVYMNTQTDLAAFGSLRDRYRSCLGDHPNCSSCARFDADADCTGGRCMRRSLLPR